MDERKFKSLQPWPEEASGASRASDEEQKQSSQSSSSSAPPPAHIETVEILSSLSRNPNNIGLLYEVAKAELESLNDELAKQVAQCADLEEEKAAHQFVETTADESDDSEELKRLRTQVKGQATELERYRDMEDTLKKERRRHLVLGVKFFDVKKELERTKKLVEAQENKVASRNNEERLEVQSKELGGARDRLEKQSAELEDERQALCNLRERYEEQTAQLQAAQARVDRPSVEFERVKAELKQRHMELKDARAKQKVLNSDLDAARTAIVELSSQLEGQLDELERLREIKSTLEERCRELEQESRIRKERGDLCEQQASAIVQHKSSLEEKDSHLEMLKNELEGTKKRYRIEMEDERRATRDIEGQLANLKIELATAQQEMDAQNTELQRAIAERDLLRINAENERNAHISQLKKQYTSAASASCTSNQSPQLSSRFGLSGMRAKRVGNDHTLLRGKAPVECIDKSLGVC